MQLSTTPRRLLLTAVLALIPPVRAMAAVQTTTTTYTYNADGAPTAVTTQVDAQAPTTVYLTWDNFVPSAAAPTTGSVLAGNGNLRGIGPTPGGAYSSEFTYDQRNRLIRTRSGTTAAAYTYYPASAMASSTVADRDALQFFYDAAPISQVANISQPSTAAWSGYLGDMTYLSDGTEQMRCQPRKDVAGLYDPAQRSFTPITYDPYGASNSTSASAANSNSYDLAQNPFRYGGEYHDATAGLYYLRARWYLPAYQAFLQRDHGDKLHRYGYTQGNPVGNIDPSGLHSVEAGARAFLGDLHAGGNGVRGSLSRFFLGGIIGTAQIIANPAGYWHSLKHDSGGTDIFLAAGVLAEVGTTGWFGLPELPGTSAAAFGVRHLVDFTIGAGQSVASGFSGHRRFDWAAVGQGMEYTAGGMVLGREVAGIGYKPYGMTNDDLDAAVASHFQNASNHNQALVFRVRWKDNIAFTTPWMEQFHIGNYHEALMAVGHDELWMGQINMHYLDQGETYTKDVNWSRNNQHTGQPSTYLNGRTPRQYQFAGVTNLAAVKDAFISELDGAGQDLLGQRPAGARAIRAISDYHTLTNNCQQYSAYLRARIMYFRDNPMEDLSVNDN